MNMDPKTFSSPQVSLSFHNPEIFTIALPYEAVGTTHGPCARATSLGDSEGNQRPPPSDMKGSGVKDPWDAVGWGAGPAGTVL